LRVLSHLLASEASAIMRRKLTMLGLYALAAVLVLAAFCFVLMGLHAWLSVELMSSIAASFLLAAALLVLALLIGGIAAYVNSRRRKQERAALAATAALISAPLAARVATTKVGLGLIALVGVTVAGAALGRRLGGG